MFFHICIHFLHDCVFIAKYAFIYTFGHEVIIQFWSLCVHFAKSLYRVGTNQNQICACALG